MLIEQYCVISFRFLYRCYEFEQVNWLTNIICIQLQAYSTSDNETPTISRVLIGRHLIFC